MQNSSDQASGRFLRSRDMKPQKSIDRRRRLYIAIFFLFITPLVIAPGDDGCPDCVIQSFYSALDDGDLDEAMTYIAEDAVLWRVDNVAYQGDAEIREQLKREIGVFSYQVDDVVADDLKSVSYSWKMISEREVWTGTDTAIVVEGQIQFSRLEVENSGS
jgi:hypothetical protein